MKHLCAAQGCCALLGGSVAMMLALVWLLVQTWAINSTARAHVTALGEARAAASVEVDDSACSAEAQATRGTCSLDKSRIHVENHRVLFLVYGYEHYTLGDMLPYVYLFQALCKKSLDHNRAHPFQYYFVLYNEKLKKSKYVKQILATLKRFLRATFDEAWRDYTTRIPALQQSRAYACHSASLSLCQYIQHTADTKKRSGCLGSHRDK